MFSLLRSSKESALTFFLFDALGKAVGFERVTNDGRFFRKGRVAASRNDGVVFDGKLFVRDIVRDADSEQCERLRHLALDRDCVVDVPLYDLILFVAFLIEAIFHEAIPM